MRWQELKNNDNLKRNLELRARITQMIRSFFTDRGYLEIDTPLLVRYPSSEPHLNSMPVDIHTDRGDKKTGFLITSPEYSLKKMLAAGFPKIFQLAKCFRDNEQWGGAHNPEFTMLEWYRVGADYHGIMDETEQLIKSVALNQNKNLSLESPWKKISMREAWQKYAGVDLNNYLTRDTMQALVKEKGYTATQDDDFSDLFFKIFLTEVEPQIEKEARPIFLYDYPIQMAALARAKTSDHRYAERFELYIGGLELANGYSELTDWQEQQRRFAQDNAKRQSLGKPILELDTDLIEAIKALPDCSGPALGVDRLVMLMCGAKDISEVVPLSAQNLFGKY